MKIDHQLKSKLEDIARRFEDLEHELLGMDNGSTWNFICSNYNGHPLENMSEFVDDIERGMYNQKNDIQI